MPKSEVSTPAVSLDKPVQPRTQSVPKVTISVEKLPTNKPDESFQIDRENVLFVYLDPHSHLLPQMILSLRAINHRLHIFNDESICYDFLQTTIDRIVFMCPTNDKDLIKAIHDLNTVDMMIVLSSDQYLERSRSPKIDGIYANFEELLIGLKGSFEWFEQTQLDLFTFERDRIFLWSQLWREEVRFFLFVVFVFYENFSFDLVCKTYSSPQNLRQRSISSCS